MKKVPEFDALFPEGTVSVGIDPSRTSTGLVVVKDGVVGSYCIYPDVKHEGVLAGVLDKESIKDDIATILSGLDVDVCVVEKVFFGGYVSSFISLVEIMNMMEELIIEGRVSVKRLIRVQNTTWKSWLRPWKSADKRTLSGNQGKQIVDDTLQNLGMLGLIEPGRGWQDRVDALGMLVGYRIQELDPVEKVSIDPDLIHVCMVGESEAKVLLEDESSESWDCSRVTVGVLRKAMEKRPGKVLVTREPVSLGFEALHMDVDWGKIGENGKGYLVACYDGEVKRRYDEWNSSDGIR